MEATRPPMDEVIEIKQTSEESKEAGPKCPWRYCKKDSISCRVPWHNPGTYPSPVVLSKLKSMVMFVGTMEIGLGILAFIGVLSYAKCIDKIYRMEESNLITLLHFVGLITLVVTGLLLVASTMLEKRRLLWVYSSMSACLCVYAFGVAILEMHCAIILYHQDIERIDKPVKPYSIFNTTPLLFGMATTVGAVMHFIGNLIVLAYFNLKFIYPILFHVQRIP